MRSANMVESQKLVEQGWFEGESLELLYGQLVPMTTQVDVPERVPSNDMGSQRIRHLLRP
jgi:hypothetical protein